MELAYFQESICAGIPEKLPEPSAIDRGVSHAPLRKEILNGAEKKLAE